MKLIPVVCFVAAIAAVAIWWQVYKFHDCKNVGHSTLYCVLDIGK